MRDAARRAAEDAAGRAARLADDATAHAVARQVQPTFVKSAPAGMPNSNYLNSFEFNPHGALGGMTAGQALMQVLGERLRRARLFLSSGDAEEAMDV